jgi:TPR repeat protein
MLKRIDVSVPSPHASATPKVRAWRPSILLTAVGISLVALAALLAHSRSAHVPGRLAVASLPPERSDATPFDQAKRAYENGEYATAQKELVAAARGGDVDAEELLGVMEAFGPTIYPGVTEDLAASSRWLDEAARSGRPVARYIYCALLRQSRGKLPGFYCFDPTVRSISPR